MIVLVDTPIWSLALRRRPADLNSQEQIQTRALAELIREGRAQMVGVIRQELLSGIREAERFAKLRDYLRAFEEPNMGVTDYELAAEMHNHCKSHGIAGSAVDFLICAVARQREWQIFSTDRDFEEYAKVLRINLYRAT